MLKHLNVGTAQSLVVFFATSALYVITTLPAAHAAGGNQAVTCGEVLVSKGDIKIEAHSSKKVSPAAAGSKICQGDTIIAGAQSRAKIKMEDGNELNISPNSRLTLEEYEYKPSENKKKVMLNVLYGKVRAATREENMYNDKAKDGQANTFRVKTKSAVAGVRGTDFLTSYDRRTNRSEIVTFIGKVEVGFLGAGGRITNAVQVGAGQKTETSGGGTVAQPKSVSSTEIRRLHVESSSDDVVPDLNTDRNQPEAPKKEESGRSDDSASTGGSGGGSGGGSQTSPSQNQGGQQGREPSSAPGAPSMISNDDLPGRGPDKDMLAGIKSPIALPPAPPALPPPPPVCDLCNRAVESGPGKVNIRIIVPQ
ncbi:MAG: FecR family protein [Bdellovibrionales bacterium]|jgi:hypothetical protein|nr:FecR family protein [Bdellovibrionales bacterium]